MSIVACFWQVFTLRAAEGSDLVATADATDSVRLFEFTPGLHRSFRVRASSYESGKVIYNLRCVMTLPQYPLSNHDLN